MSNKAFEQQLREDFKEIHDSLYRNYKDRMTLKNKGIGRQAQAEFARKANNIKVEWHKEVALLGALDFLLDMMEAYKVPFNTAIRQELATYLENIDKGFLNFEVNVLNKNVQCDFNLGYNSMLKFYKKTYPNKIYPKREDFGKRCKKRNKINQIMLDKLKESIQ